MILLTRKETIELAYALEEAYQNLQTEFGPGTEQDRVQKQTMTQVNFVRRLLELGPYYDAAGNFGDPLPEE